MTPPYPLEALTPDGQLRRLLEGYARELADPVALEHLEARLAELRGCSGWVLFVPHFGEVAQHLTPPLTVVGDDGAVRCQFIDFQDRYSAFWCRNDLWARVTFNVAPSALPADPASARSRSLGRRTALAIIDRKDPQ